VIHQELVSEPIVDVPTYPTMNSDGQEY